MGKLPLYLNQCNSLHGSNVTDLLSYCEETGSLITRSFGMISISERGMLLTSLLMGDRRLKKCLGEIERKQKKSLLPEADFDAREVKGLLNAIVAKLDPYMTPPKEETTEDLEEVLDLDNAEHLLIEDERGGGYKQMRRYLLSNYQDIYTKIKDAVSLAGTVLDSLAELQESIETDSDCREKIWEQMKSDYQKRDWPDRQAAIVYRIQQEMADAENERMAKVHILERELKLLAADHTTGIHNRELRELNQTVTESKRSPIDVLMKHRNSIQEEDLTDYFCYLYSYKYIKEAKESILLREAAQLDLLFYNKAAQEYVETLIPILKANGGLIDKGHYGILKIVLQELGLVDAEKGNGIQMMDFVNEKMIDDEIERLPRQDSITSVTGKLNKQTFARLGSEGIGRTKFSDNDYTRMKDIYWRCFTILNHYGLVDVNEVGYDGYLANPHPFTNTYDPWESLDKETNDRLEFLAFVLRGDGTPF